MGTGGDSGLIAVRAPPVPVLNGPPQTVADRVVRSGVVILAGPLAGHHSSPENVRKVDLVRGGCVLRCD
jgi:hypothetical protein